MDVKDLSVQFDTPRQYSAKSDDGEAQISLIFDTDGRVLLYLPRRLWMLKNAVSVQVSCCFLLRKPNEPFDFSKVKKIDLSRDKELDCLSISVSEMQSLKDVAIRYYTMQRFPQEFMDIINDNSEIDPQNLRIVDNESSTSRVLTELLFGLLKVTDNPRLLSKISPDLQNLEKLAIFGNEIPKNLSDAICRLRSLKELHVESFGLEKLPDAFGELQNLEELTLKKNANLDSLCATFGKLQSLRQLRIERCGVKRLSDSFGEMAQLQATALKSDATHELLSFLHNLSIVDCGLQTLPDEFGILGNLRELTLKSNSKLESLGSSFGKLRFLQNLHIEDCALKKLPDQFHELAQLQQLTLKNNIELSSLGSSFEKLSSLEILCIESCSLRSLPEQFHELSKLSELTLACNKNLQSLSPSFGKLPLLRYLFISNSSLSSLPSTFGSLSKLEELIMLHNYKLKSLSKVSFGDLSSLKRLRIMSCSINRLPNYIGKLSKLEILTLSENSQLESLPSSFGDLESLKDLQITSCGITSLPESFKNLKSLRHLDLSLNHLETFSRCINGLQKLETFHCSVSQGTFSKKGNSIGREELRWTRRPGIKIPLPIFKQGQDAITSYVEKIKKKDSIYTDTINVVGENGAAITSLAKCLCKISERREVKKNRSGDAQEIPMTSQNDNSDNSLYRIYKLNTPALLPSNGLVVLVCNTDTSPNDQEKALMKWVLTVAAKSETVRMLVVFAYPDNWIPKMYAAYEKQMDVFLQRVLKNLKEEVQLKLDQAKNNLVATKTLGILRSKIDEADVIVSALNVKNSADTLEKLKKLVLPRLRQPDEMPSIWVNVMHEILIHSSYFLTMEEIQAIYTSQGGDAEYTDLPYILRYLMSRSQIIWLERNPKLCNIVFHSPTKIFDVCQQILCKDQASELQEGLEGEFTGMQLKNELLLTHSNLDSDVVIEFLLHFTLVRHVKKYDEINSTEQTYIVPSKFADKEPQWLTKQKSQLLQCTNKVCLHLSFFGSVNPNSFLETCISVMVETVYGLLTDSANIRFWKKGLFVDEAGKILAAECEDDLIVLTAASTSASLSPWFLLRPVLSALHEYFCASWAGAPPQASIQCPACAKAKNRTDAANTKGDFKLPLDNLCFNFASKSTAAKETSNQSIENVAVICNVCRAKVPKILCTPVSTDNFSESQQWQIKKFYQHLDAIAEVPLQLGVTEVLCPESTVIPKGEKVYSMHETNHGLCLIISNKNFPDVNHCRLGTEKDVERLNATFTKLGYKVTVLVDQTAINMANAMSKFAAESHEKFDSFVCCIMSHGEEEGVLGSDNDLVTVETLTKPFISTNCRSLTGKPKLFFLQACRGKRMQQGAPQKDAPATGQQTCTPENADFLIGYSTVFGCYSIRYPLTGSVYMQTLCDVLSSESNRWNLNDMLIEVNNRISKMKFQDGMQMPEYKTSLRKNVRFRPMEKQSNDEISKLEKATQTTSTISTQTGSDNRNCNCDCFCCKIACHCCCRSGKCNKNRSNKSEGCCSGNCCRKSGCLG